jgi:cephalosporin hydroxylase
VNADVVAAFHRAWYEAEAQTWKTLTWCGVPLLKNPLDLMILQELITTIRPATIVETGSYRGGSALFYATVCAVVAPRCLIITVDHDADLLVDHPSIFPVPGDSVAPATVAHVRGLVEVGADHGPCLVLLDSDHSAAHVLAELRAYSPLVTPGSYLVVEDTNLGHEVVPGFGPGPREALGIWFAEDAPPFEADPHCERLGVTWSPNGWLRRTE